MQEMHNIYGKTEFLYVHLTDFFSIIRFVIFFVVQKWYAV